MLIRGPGRVCNTDVPLNSHLGRDLGRSVLREIPKVHNHVAECILPFVKRGVLADRSKAASPRKTSVKRRFFAIHTMFSVKKNWVVVRCFGEKSLYLHRVESRMGNGRDARRLRKVV